MSLPRWVMGRNAPFCTWHYMCKMPRAGGNQETLAVSGITFKLKAQQPGQQTAGNRWQPQRNLPEESQMRGLFAEVQAGLREPGRFGGAPTHGLSQRAVTTPKSSSGSVGIVFLEPAYCWLHRKEATQQAAIARIMGGQRRKNKCLGLSLQSPSRFPWCIPLAKPNRKWALNRAEEKYGIINRVPNPVL